MSVPWMPVAQVCEAARPDAARAASLREAVEVLAETIGPRGTGSAGEAAAADYVANRLEDLGLGVVRRPLKAVPSQNSYPIASDVLALTATVAGAVGGGAGRWVAAGLSLAAGPLLWHAVRLSVNALRPLIPRVRSQNVVCRVPAAGPSLRASQGRAPQRVVILAHLDTNRCRIAWRSGAVRWLEPLTWLTLSMFGAQGLLYLAEAVDGLRRQGGSRAHNRPGLRSRLGPRPRLGRGSRLGPRPRLERRSRPGRWWWAGLAPSGYILGTLITLIRDEWTPFSPGAHDNAASVAVALELAADLVERPLNGTEVWLAFTGAEETDHAGLYTLLRDDPSGMRDAVFLGLEGLGSGHLAYLVREGLCDHVAPDPGLVAAAQRAARRVPDVGARAAEMTVEDEVCTLRRLGYRALCIAGCDPGAGTLPHWHRRDDTADTVSAGFMEGAVRYVRGLLEELDTGAEALSRANALSRVDAPSRADAFSLSDVDPRCAHGGGWTGSQRPVGGGWCLPS